MIRTAISPRRLLLWLAVLVFALLVVAASAGRPMPAYAAADFTVDSTADITAQANQQTCNSPCSLREALQAADNRASIGGILTTTIAVNAGNYNLDQALGALQVGAVPGQVLNLNGSGGVIITQAPGCTEAGARSCMVLFLDPNSVGNFTANIANLTITGGHTALGGGGIAGGAISTGGTTPGDNTTISNSTIQGNSATGAPGGGIGYLHGNLTITNSTIAGNTANTASGGGIDYTDIDPSAGTLTITNSTIGHNSSTQSGAGGGGALHILGTHANVVVTGSVFDHNTASASVAPGGGGAIDQESGTLSVHNSTFTSNDAGGSGSGGAINVEIGSANLGDATTAGLNRLALNTGGSGGALYVSGVNHPTVSAENDWWGTNNPATVISGAAPTAFFKLTLMPSPAAIGRAGTANLSADLTHNNQGATPGLLPNEAAIPVSWPTPTSLGTISNATTTLSSTPGTATATYNAGSTPGDDTVSVQVDGATATTVVEIVAPPKFSKSFNPTSIPVNGSASLTFQLSNSNTLTDLTGVGFSDSLPAGLSVASATSSACGGTLTVTAPSSIALSGATLAKNGGACTLTVTVTGTSAGSMTNVTGNVAANESGSGGNASATLQVEAPPTISKAFSPTTIGLNATTSLAFTITNPAANPVALSGVAFIDTLPAGLSVASSTSTVCGGTLTATAPGTIALNGATVATNSSCQFSVTVTGTASGGYTNTTGSVSSTNGGTGSTASASLVVASPPQITKAYGAATMPVNGTTTLTIQIANPNPALTLTGVAFSDTLPPGQVVASPGNLGSNCGGTPIAVDNSASISLSGGTINAGATCTLSVNVTSMNARIESNQTSPVTSNEGGTGNTATASITVVAPPSLSKAFGAASIPVSGSTSLTFTVNNPNGFNTALTGVGFSDTLPGGLVVSTPNGLAGSCGGGTITATQGSGVISLSGATLPANSACVFSVNVTGTSAGTKTNTTSSVASNEGGAGSVASATIHVDAPPAIAKAFNPSTIALNATTSLTFTISNPAANPDPAVGVAFVDTLPSGLTVAGGTSLVCGGTLTTTTQGTVALSGASVAPASSCQFSVTVTGAASGSFTNTTGSVSSTDGGTGSTASASLVVASPPQISKAFGAAAIALNATTSLTFTITNPNSGGFQLTGIGFSDSFPAGLLVASPSNLSNTCGGTATAASGAAAASLSGGTLAAGASCTITLNVQGIAAGVMTNTAGPVTSNEAGAGGTASATVAVVSIKLSPSANPAIEGNTNVTYTATVAPVPPSGTVTFYDGGSAIGGCSNVGPNAAGIATCNAGVYPTAGTHVITATYSFGPVTSAPLIEVVSDAALIASPGANLTANGNDTIPATSVVATFVDTNPFGVAGDFKATIKWGDGASSAGTVSARSGGGFQVRGGHTYEDSGSFMVTVTITDTKGGATATVSLTATAGGGGNQNSQ